MDARELSLLMPIRLASAALPARACDSFHVELVKQDTLVWCWAAVAVSLLETFGSNQPDGQCGVVKQVKKACKGRCKDKDACYQTSDIKEVFQVLKLGFQELGKLTVPLVEDAISAGDPIVAETALGEASTHLMIVHGYCPDAGTLIIMDPIAGFDTHEWELKLFFVVETFRVPRLQQAAASAGSRRLPRGRGPQPTASEEPEPAGAAELIESRLPALLDRARPLAGGETRGAGAVEISRGVPIRLWDTPDVLSGRLEGTVSLGWRHIVFLDRKALMAIDLVMSGGELAFKKASRGPAVPGIAAAMAKLAEEARAATEIALLEVPCVAMEVLWYKNAVSTEQFMIAFSPFAEFAGLPIFRREDFTAEVSEKANEERVTNQV